MPRSLLPGSSFREGYCVLHSVETQHATSLRLFDQPVGAAPYVRLVFFGGLGALARNPSFHKASISFVHHIEVLKAWRGDPVDRIRQLGFM